MDQEQFQAVRDGAVLTDRGGNKFMAMVRPGSQHIAVIPAIDAEMAQHWTVAEEGPEDERIYREGPPRKPHVGPGFTEAGEPNKTAATPAAAAAAASEAPSENSGQPLQPEA